jgi:hypothetical protein
MVMVMRSTHTYARLPLSPQAYEEIATKLRTAGYDHAFIGNGDIDMHGEDKVQEALHKALAVAVRNHSKFLGNDVKSVCWDVREEFEKAIRNG